MRAILTVCVSLSPVAGQFLFNKGTYRFSYASYSYSLNPL